MCVNAARESQRRSLLPDLSPLAPSSSGLLCPPQQQRHWLLATEGFVGGSSSWSSTRDRKLPTGISLQPARVAVASGERRCWPLGPLAGAQGTDSGRLGVKCSPPPAFAHLLQPVLGIALLERLLIQEYGAGVLAWLWGTLLAFFLFK